MSRAESKARTRERLLDAARQVFEERGFYAATVEQIVHRADFTRGAFYANWSDKADVLWELIERSNQQRFEQMVREVSAAPLDSKMEVVQAWFSATIGNWPLGRARAELNASLQDSDTDRERLAHLFAVERKLITTLLESIAEALGVTLPIPLDHFAAMGLALGYGLSQQHQVDPEVVPADLFAVGQAALWMGVIAYDEMLKTDAGAATTGEQA